MRTFVKLIETGLDLDIGSTKFNTVKQNSGFRIQDSEALKGTRCRVCMCIAY